MNSVSVDYKKMIQLREQQLIVLKQEKFLMYEQLEDV
jgi:hypothetical protein